MTQSIFIIGAGPGIGQAVARKFGKQGWQIILAARSRTNLDDLVADLADSGISAQALVVDATDPAALQAAFAEADRITGGLSAVHFNAAVVRQQDLFSMSDDEVTGDLAVNVAAGLHSIRAAAAQFGTRGGTILVTGGGLAIAPHESYASLGIGKAALRNGVQALVEPRKRLISGVDIFFERAIAGKAQHLDAGAQLLVHGRRTDAEIGCGLPRRLAGQAAPLDDVAAAFGKGLHRRRDPR